mmetsp:Transcript_99029/g.269023  ORF Transcript_99029/g.269023 Transcript_99029/m.269023 type:complete len:228 (+) Transcript_99029:146-829(+)
MPGCIIPIFGCMPPAAWPPGWFIMFGTPPGGPMEPMLGMPPGLMFPNWPPGPMGGRMPAGMFGMPPGFGMAPAAMPMPGLPARPPAPRGPTGRRPGGCICAPGLPCGAKDGGAPPWFSLIHICTCILALSLATGSAAVMMMVLAPPGCATVSRLICAPLSVASFLIVAPPGPINFPIKLPGHKMLLSTAPPPAATAPGMDVGTMALAPAPGAAPDGCPPLRSLIMSP